MEHKRHKRYFRALMMLLFTSGMLNCTPVNIPLNTNHKYGTLFAYVQFPEQGFSIKNIPEATSVILVEINGENLTEAVIFQLSSDNPTKTLENVPTGSKIINVSAFDENGNTLAIGFNTVIIKEDLLNKVEIELVSVDELAASQNLKGMAGTALIAVGKTLAIADILALQQIELFDFSSADESIIKIEGNNVTGLKEGNTILTVSLKENPENKADFEIIVREVIVTSVKIEPAVSKLDIDSSTKLKATVFHSDGSSSEDVSWKSLDESIATVSEDGTVKAVAQGEAKIEARSLKDNTISSTATILVDLDKVVVSEIIVSPVIMAIAKGNNSKLQAQVIMSDGSANDLVRFQSNDSAIAAVDAGGSVSGKESGKTFITVFSTQDESKFLKVPVTVFEPAIVINSIEINPINPVVKEKENIKLDATLSRSDGSTSNEVSWNSLDENIATVNQDGLVTGVKEGRVKIEAVAKESDKVKAAVILTVSNLSTEEILKSVNQGNNNLQPLPPQSATPVFLPKITLTFSSPTPSPTATPTPTPTPTATPTASPTPTPTPTPTATPTPTPTSVPTSTSDTGGSVSNPPDPVLNVEIIDAPPLGDEIITWPTSSPSPGV